MTAKQAIELLLNRMNRLRNVNTSFLGAMDGTVGPINVLQREMNQALAAWQEHGNTHGLQQLAGTLQAYGNLTEEEYQQIMKALGGEK